MAYGLEKAVEDMAGALTDPIVVMDPDWPVPDSLREAVVLQRLLQVKDGKQGLATEAEALAYIQNASMVGPLREDWLKICFWLFTRVWGKFLGNEVPDELREDSLPRHLQDDLTRLREWLWRKKLEGRKRRRRGEESTNAAETATADRPVQLLFFSDGR